MSGPFKPGELVACVDARPARWHEPKSEKLALGSLHRVKAYFRGFPFGPGIPRSFIVREGDDDKSFCWDAYRFAPVQPSSDAFTTQIRACRPIKRSVDA